MLHIPEYSRMEFHVLGIAEFFKIKFIIRQMALFLVQFLIYTLIPRF